MCANFSHDEHWCASQCLCSPPHHTSTFGFECIKISRRICYICSRNICFVVRIFAMNIWMAQVCSLFPLSADCVESVLMTECYVPFHSLTSNGIGHEGCKALTAVLQQCKQLQVLRWVSNDVLLTLLTAIQLTTYMHIVNELITSCMWSTEAAELYWLAVVECTRYLLYVAHNKWHSDISLCKRTLIWFIDQEAHSEIVFSAQTVDLWSSLLLSLVVYTQMFDYMGVWCLIT